MSGCAGRTAANERLPAELVLIAVGARANDDLAAAAGLACQDGIVVDATARTAHPDIYAVGDCTRFPSRRYSRALRLECVQNAIDQAKVAAASILQTPAVYDPVPWFWSDQYDLKLQIAGLNDGHERSAVIGDPQSARFSVEYQCDGRLIAVDAIKTLDPTPEQPKPPEHPCPCCGGPMRIIETFLRGQQPRHTASPMPQPIRIDTS